MRYGTYTTATGPTAVRIEADGSVSVLDHPDAAAAAAVAASGAGPLEPLDATRLLGPSLTPAKIICVGLNYESHIREMGRDLPTHPTLFAKFARSLVGPNDPIRLPSNSQQVDWEAELGVVIGREVRHATTETAHEAIAGYTIVNDISMRDWQWRTTQWLAGKTFEASTPVGPIIVTPDEVDHASDLEIGCEINGEPMQLSRTSDLVFKPADVVAYASSFITLEPGDLLALGTPGGVGAKQTPPRFLRPGDTVRTYIEGIGELVNRCVLEDEE